MKLSIKILSVKLSFFILSSLAFGQNFQRLKERVQDCEDSEKCVMASILTAVKRVAPVESRREIDQLKEQMRNNCSRSELSCQGLYVLDGLSIVHQLNLGNLAEENRRIEEERLRQEERARAAEIERSRRRQRERERRERERLQCIGTNFHGKWAQGGGCNFHGCWYTGGGCNFHGCWETGGSCNFHGCTKEAPKTKKACID